VRIVCELRRFRHICAYLSIRLLGAKCNSANVLATQAKLLKTKERTQNPALRKEHVGSTPTSSTNSTWVHDKKVK